MAKEPFTPTKEGSNIRRRNMNSPQPPTPVVQSTSGPSSRVNITDFTIRIPGTGKGGDVGPEPGPSRWRTREFMFYYVVFAVVVPMMVRIPARLSATGHHNYWTYAGRLSDGWLLGWKVDNSDPQYRSFRSNLPALLLLASAHLICSTVWSKLAPPSPRSRTSFIAGFSLLMLGVLHGTSIAKVLIILGANYWVAKAPKSEWVERFWPGLVIGGNMMVLFLNERNDGYRFAHLHGAFEVLDRMDGLLPRWHINFNITMLRIVSFALDYHWRQSSSVGASLPEDHRRRVSTPLPDEDYSLLTFIAYALYPPLYIAGPIMTFNDFTWQIRRPTSISWRDQLSYAVRFTLCLLTMETVLHTMYVVAIKDSAAWEGDSPAEMSMIGFWNLVVVWLKLLIPWRYFRLWALLDGVDPPENMIRCVANNYSTLGFWRSWHRSYNLWVVRYLYIPVGGSKNVVAATVLVFTFVALWHDLSFKLLAWGWLVSLFVLPEIIAKAALPFDKYGHERWYRPLAGLGGVFNILLLMSANLVGFVLGLDGMRHLLTELTSSISGLLFLAFSAACLYVAVQVMFEYREEERRRGIDRKC